MLKVTGLSYANPGGCQHIVVDYEDNAVPGSFELGHETQVLDALQRLVAKAGFEGREEEFLLTIWLAVMIKKRGATKASCINVDIEP